MTADGLNAQLSQALRDGSDFTYADHAYFNRGPFNFRLIRGELHLTKLLDRPGDRLKKLGVELKPWKQGSNVLVIPPSRYQAAIYGAETWLEDTLASLKTDRPVIVKHDKQEPLEPLLRDAWCVVTFASAAGVQAAVAGVPVFAGPYCPCKPISAGSDIERPVFHDRLPWLRSLSYAQWNTEEVERINFKDYRY